MLCRVLRCMEAFGKREAELISEASICLCDTCKRMGQFRLKMILHRGEVAFVQVRQFNKEGGEDILLAHRLLKNSVPCDEYILMTEAFVEARPDSSLEGRPMQQRTEKAEGFGEVSTHVIDFQNEGQPKPVVSTLGRNSRCSLLWRAIYSSECCSNPAGNIRIWRDFNRCQESGGISAPLMQEPHKLARTSAN
jgi:hypothetical protein